MTITSPSSRTPPGRSTVAPGRPSSTRPSRPPSWRSCLHHAPCGGVPPRHQAHEPREPTRARPLEREERARRVKTTISIARHRVDIHDAEVARLRTERSPEVGKERRPRGLPAPVRQLAVNPRRPALLTLVEAAPDLGPRRPQIAGPAIRSVGSLTGAQFAWGSRRTPVLSSTARTVIRYSRERASSGPRSGAGVRSRPTYRAHAPCPAARTSSRGRARSRPLPGRIVPDPGGDREPLPGGRALDRVHDRHAHAHLRAEQGLELSPERLADFRRVARRRHHAESTISSDSCTA